MLEAWLKRIDHDDVEPLPEEEQQRLLKKYHRTRDEEIKKKLIKHNLRLAYSFAKKYFHLTKETDELISLANEGLCIAIERFDPDKGKKLSTYTFYWVRQRIFSFLNEENPHQLDRSVRSENDIDMNEDDGKVKVLQCLEHIDPIQKIIIKRKAGLLPYTQSSFSEISNDLNLTSERVRQLYNEGREAIRETVQDN